MKTILFADDHTNIREYCRAAFGEEGYRVVLARDGIEALEMFVTETPDLAILDISMPRSSGLEMLEQIKGISLTTPVVLFTAQEEDYMRDHRTRLGHGMCAKSSDLGELKQIVAQSPNREIAEGRWGAARRGPPPFPASVDDQGLAGLAETGDNI